MLEICIQTSYDQNVQLILKSYLPVVYGTLLKNYCALEALIVRFDQMFGGVSVANLSIFLCGVALRCTAFLLHASCVTINVMKCTRIGEKGATIQVLRSIKKWTPSY